MNIKVTATWIIGVVIFLSGCSAVNGSDNQPVKDEVIAADAYMPPHGRIRRVVEGRCLDENIPLEKKKYCGTQKFPFEYLRDISAPKFKFKNNKAGREYKKISQKLDELVWDSLKKLYQSSPEDFSLNVNTVLLKLESKNKYYCDALRPDLQRYFSGNQASTIYLKTYLWVAYRKFLLTGDSKGFAKLVDSIMDSRCWNLFDRLYLSPDDRTIINGTSGFDDFRVIFAFYQAGKKRDGLAAYFLFKDYLGVNQFEKKAEYRCIADIKFLQSAGDAPIDFDGAEEFYSRRISNISGNLRHNFISNCMAHDDPNSDLCIAQIESCGVKLSF